MKSCRSCGRDLAADARFCDRCGQDQTYPTPRPFQFIASGAMIGAIVIILILIIASIPKVPVSQQYMTTTQTQLMTTTQFQTVTVTQTMQTTGPRQLLEYCFSPGGNCASIIIHWIDHANVSVHVLIYSFTLDSIGDAVIRAKNRGLDVRVVIEKDNRNTQGSEWQRLKDSGVQIRLDGNSADMHDKVAIIDSTYVITGSFNWSQNANERNNENLILFRDQAWAQGFEAQFTIIWNKATT